MTTSERQPNIFLAICFPGRPGSISITEMLMASLGIWFLSRLLDIDLGIFSEAALLAAALKLASQNRTAIKTG